MTHPTIHSAECWGYPRPQYAAIGWCDKCERDINGVEDYAENLYKEREFLCQTCIAKMSKHEILEYCGWELV